MKRTFSLLWLMLFTLYSWAQEVFQSKVVDAETGEPLPYASIHISNGRGTLSNLDGYFSIEAGADDSLRISYIGYIMQTI